MIETEEVRHGEDGDIGAEIADEPLIRAEDEPPHIRAQPVRADHQIEPARRDVGESDVDAALIEAYAASAAGGSIFARMAAGVC
jgi:hypothetical protein